MSIRKFYKYLGVGNMLPLLASELVEGKLPVTNTSAIYTKDRTTFVKMDNTAFTTEEELDALKFLYNIETQETIAQKLFNTSYQECDTEEKLEVKRLLKTRNHK